MRNEEQPIGIKETAVFTGYSVSTIYKLTSKGEIPHHKLSPKKLVFYKSELNEWIQNSGSF